MEIVIHEHCGDKIAEVRAEGVAFTEVGDALDAMADAYHQGADALVLHATNLTPGFFDLKTGLAGEVLQKFTNYGIRLAIVGDFEAVESKSLRAFIAESNRGRHVAFVADLETALERLRSS